MTVLSKKTVDEQLASAQAALEAPIEIADEKVIEIVSREMYELYDLATDEVAFGRISWPKKGGGFAFIDDAFIPPYIAGTLKGFELDTIFSAHCRKGPKGRVVTGIVPVAEYLGWHPEVVSRLKAEMVEDKKHDLEWALKSAKSEADCFNRKVESMKKLGYSLVEIRSESSNRGYGARGTDVYVFEEEVCILDIDKIIDGLHGRHTDDLPGGYFHGRDDITRVEGGHGIKNAWMGPYTD